MPDNSLDLANFLQNSVRNATGDTGMFGGNNGFMWLLILLLFGGGYGGFGGLGRNGAGAVINDAAITGAIETAIAKAQSANVSDQLVLQAINGNKEALTNIATALNCDFARVSDALNTISCGIDKLGGQVGMSTQQVINAIQAGNCTLANQLQSCCCDLRTAITNAGYENQLQILNQTNALTSQIQSQTALLGAKIDAQTQIINDRFCQLEVREQARIIDAQNAKISDLKNKLSTQEILTAIASKSSTTPTTSA